MLVVNPLFPPVTARPSMPLHPSGARSESLQQPIAGRGRVRRTPIRPIEHPRRRCLVINASSACFSCGTLVPRESSQSYSLPPLAPASCDCRGLTGLLRPLSGTCSPKMGSVSPEDSQLNPGHPVP